jgi:hypothetical protein
MSPTMTLLKEVLPESAVNGCSGWLRRSVLERTAPFTEGSA